MTASVTADQVSRLNERFGHAGRVRFAVGMAGLPRVSLEFGPATLELYLQGAHITRYQPRNGMDLLWMSDSAVYQTGKALRGGIPLCWPWFGAAADNAARPQHGYARTSEFAVVSAQADDSATSIVLALDAAAAPYPDWANKLQLEFEIRLADSLWMEMRSHNQGAESIVISNALHTYFAISQRDNVTVPALTGLAYLDKLQDYREQLQSDAIELRDEVDRVYLGPPATVELRDRGRQLVSRVKSWGNNNLVVWNPGARQAQSMADFDDLGYQHMLCIEPANALAQSVSLQPGENHRLGQCISVAALAQD